MQVAKCLSQSVRRGLTLVTIDLLLCRWYYGTSMVTLPPTCTRPGPQLLRPSDCIWTGRRLSAGYCQVAWQSPVLRLSPFRLRLFGLRRWVSFPRAPAVAELRACAILSVLSGSPPAQRDAELHGRPVGVEADQLELAREVVPVGVCPSSAAR
jgi:hypothetical protein